MFSKSDKLEAKKGVECSSCHRTIIYKFEVASIDYKRGTCVCILCDASGRSQAGVCA